MLDIGFIRENADRVRKAVRDKLEKRADVEEVLRLDGERREVLARTEALRNERNASSKQIAELKKKGENADEMVRATRELGDRIHELEEVLREVSLKLAEQMLWIPNVPAEDVPVGRDANDNVEVKHWGARKAFSFELKAHWDLAEELDIIDFPRATKISGPHWALYKGAGARLERALINFMLDLHTGEHGYTEILPPYLVNRDSMTGTGQLPKLEEDMYHTDRDDLFLIPTAEVPVTNLHRDEILEGKQLPVYYTAYTGCFRREAGSYGKATRALLRVHQFDKVELVKFVRPGTSYDELEKLRANAEAVLERLGLEYRVLTLCTGELSFSGAKCYDIELWAPGVKRWLEVSSCSNFEDFQARRANIRFRDEDGKVKFVHTLNGSGTALARLVVAILETYQNADGTVTVPEVLRPYMGGLTTIARR